MPSPQPIVLPSSNINFFRLSINQLADGLNYMLGTAFFANGNVTITMSSPDAVALNVVNGSIWGNGSQLYSVNAASLLGTANNSRLENTTFTIQATNGLFANATTISLGSAVSINVNVVDSITSTRTDLPASANSLRWAMQAANANSSNATLVSYVVDESIGGTGKSSYQPGELLIGNTISGKLDKGFLTANTGISTSLASGSITISANLIQGPGMLLTSSGNSGITIQSNAYAEGNTTQSGIVRLYDYADSTSNTLAVTANAVNALVRYLDSLPATGNVYGRLISRQVFTTSNLAGIPGIESGTSYTWTKPANTHYINLIVMSGGGAGGPSLNLVNSLSTVVPQVFGIQAAQTAASFGPPGEAGSIAYWQGPGSIFPSDTISLFVGGGGTTRNGGAGNGGDSWFSSTSFLRTPGGSSGNTTLKVAPSSLGGTFTQRYSPFSDMATNTFSTLNPASMAWPASIKGSNTQVRDAGVYTDSTFWDAFRGLSEGVGSDMPAFGIPYSGRLGQAVSSTDPNAIWPFFGGRGGSTPYGRGGFGGTLTGDNAIKISQVPASGNSGNITGTYLSNRANTNFNNDLWYNHRLQGAGVEYGQAPHLLSVTKGQKLTSSSVTTINLPSRMKVGDVLVLIYADRPGNRTCSDTTWKYSVWDENQGSVFIPPGGIIPTPFFVYDIAAGYNGSPVVVLSRKVVQSDIDNPSSFTITNTTGTTKALWYILRFSGESTGFTPSVVDFGWNSGGLENFFTISGTTQGAFPTSSVNMPYYSTQAQQNRTEKVFPTNWNYQSNTFCFLEIAGGTPTTTVNITSPPEDFDLSWDWQTTGGTGIGEVFLSYGLRIKKDPSPLSVINQIPTFLGSVSTSGVWSGITQSATTVNYFLVGLRGNTSAPWNTSTRTLPSGDLASSAISYYKFQQGQDGTGYGSGGGGHAKGGGNYPWDGETFTVHGGNGAPGLVIVEAYSDV